MIKGAIFDMDGLLFDTEKVFQETWNEIADEIGVVLPPEFKYRICGTSGDLTFRIIEEYYGVKDGQSIAQDCYGRVAKKVSYGVDMKPGVEKILAMLRRKQVKTAVASSTALPVVEHNLEMSGLRKYFDGVVSGQDVARGKPAPDVFLAAAARIGVAPGDCVVLEDSVSGLQAARAAGMGPVMVPDLVQPDEETRGICLGIFRDLAAASDYLEKLC